MIGFARFTAIIFMLLGLVVIVAGGGLVYSSLRSSPAPAPTLPGLIPNQPGLMVFAGVVAGAAVAFQGLLLAAVGQVLWLMASMVAEAKLSTEYMAELVRRMGNAIR